MDGKDKAVAHFMEVERKLTEVLGENEGIRIMQRDQQDNNSANQGEHILGGKYFVTETVVLESKRKCMDIEYITEDNGDDFSYGPIQSGGPKKFAIGGSCGAGPPRSMSLFAWNMTSWASDRVYIYIYLT